VSEKPRLASCEKVAGRRPFAFDGSSVKIRSQAVGPSFFSSVWRFLGESDHALASLAIIVGCVWCVLQNVFGGPGLALRVRIAAAKLILISAAVLFLVTTVAAFSLVSRQIHRHRPRYRAPTVEAAPGPSGKTAGLSGNETKWTVAEIVTPTLIPSNSPTRE
jgi:hypothetical protein